MNILPLKKWHVRRKENVEKVRHDEAEAKAKEEELKSRAEIAEREARLDFMKKRARERDGVSSDEEDKSSNDKPSSSATPKNINLFSDLEQGVGVQLTNVEHDAEKKAEQEKLEKKIGLLNYLVDKDKSEDPWYLRKKITEESAKSKQKKSSMDPMNQMKEYLTKKRKADDLQQEQLRKSSSTSRTTLTAPSLTLTSSVSERSGTLKSKDKMLAEESIHHTHKHKHKKHKKKNKLREEIKAEKSSQLEKLRQERRKREEVERTRSEAMLKGHYVGGDTTEETACSVVEKPGRYFSQFNPHLTRQRRSDQ